METGGRETRGEPASRLARAEQRNQREGSSRSAARNRKKKYTHIYIYIAGGCNSADTAERSARKRAFWKLRDKPSRTLCDNRAIVEESSTMDVKASTFRFLSNRDFLQFHRAGRGDSREVSPECNCTHGKRLYLNVSLPSSGRTCRAMRSHGIKVSTAA